MSTRGAQTATQSKKISYVGPTELRDYRLRERLYADIEPSEGASVWGVLYKIDHHDLRKLDISEGLHHSPNPYYTRTVIEVLFNGQTTRAITYIMTESGIAEREGLPYNIDESRHYRQQCYEAAVQLHIPNGFTVFDPEIYQGKQAIIWVAVYGTLLKGERNEHCAGTVQLRRPCKLSGTLYDTHHGYPAFEPASQRSSDPADYCVEGELLYVFPENKQTMDQLEGYPTLYRTETVRVFCPDMGTWEEALVYVMNNLPSNATPIPSHAWKHRFENDPLVSHRIGS